MWLESSSDRMSEGNIFENKTAWFSVSCKPSRINQWEMHGGRIVDVYVADILFSEDAGHDDTVWLYNQEKYKQEEMTIFHPAYIDACVYKKSMLKVNLCNYILPSLEAQDVMKREDIEFDLESPKLQNLKWK